MKEENKNILITWVVLAFLWDFFLIGGVTYLVFWKGHSGWWFVLAIVLGLHTTLFDKLKAI